MRTHPVALPLWIAFIAALSLLAGCKDPTASPDQVISYIESAREGAPVRRLWPAGQQYVNTVLAADAKLRDAAAALLAAPTDYFAPASQAKPPAQAALEEQAKSLEEALDEKAAAEREKRLDALRAAVEAVPDAWFPRSDLRSAFVDKVWDALRIDGVDIRELDRELTPALRANLLVLKAAIANPGEGMPALVADVAKRRARALEQNRAAAKDAGAQLEALRSERKLLKQEVRAAAPGEGVEDELRSIDDAIDRQLARRRRCEDTVKRLEKPVVWAKAEKAEEAATAAPATVRP